MFESPHQVVMLFKPSLCLLLASFALTIRSEEWVQTGSDIDGKYSDEKAGYDVALNGAGNIIVVGAPFNSEYALEAGQVRIYEQNYNGTWVQKGQGINGENAEDQCGISVELSDDGNIVAIASAGYSDVFYKAGQVRVFEWLEGDWVQRGSDIYGEADDERIGEA